MTGVSVCGFTNEQRRPSICGSNARATYPHRVQLRLEGVREESGRFRNNDVIHH